MRSRHSLALALAVLLLVATAAAASDDLVSAPFADLCAGDSSSAMQNSALWQQTASNSTFGAGSMLTFTLCGNTSAVSSARLMVNDRWTSRSVVDLHVPVNMTASPVNASCTQASGWTTLLVIAGGNIVSELRAVANSTDTENFVARRCIV